MHDKIYILKKVAKPKKDPKLRKSEKVSLVTRHGDGTKVVPNRQLDK
jgi:hypothetical protein